MVARGSPVTTLPLSDLDEEVSKVVDRLEKDGGHVVFTRNGEPAAVLMSSEQFAHLTERDRFMRGVLDGLADVEVGRVHATAEVKAALEQDLGPIEWK